MIDLKAARQDPGRYRTALARRGAAADFDALLAADATWRELTERAETLRADQKKASRGGPPTPEQRAELKRLADELSDAQAKLAHAERERQELLDRIPNLPDPAAADGMAEEDAEVVRVCGAPPAFAFEPKDAADLGSKRGWIDMRRGARLSGSRFAYRIGDVAQAELALYRFVLDKLAGYGFLPVLPPVLVQEQAMYGTGFLPTEESNLYHLEKDDLYLTGTSEVALACLHAGERLEESDLPARYMGYSTNFRREAGAAGKDTRGMFRVHQFDKVEMYVYCLPEQSAEFHERLLGYEEEIIQALGLPYRVMNISVGDLGAPAAKKFDIEGWFPAQQRYRELTSCSNTTDYQARRLNIRYRRDKNLEFVHTLNGTGATARSLLAIMENFQDEGGTVAVPEVLRNYGAPATLVAPAANPPGRPDVSDTATTTGPAPRYASPVDYSTYGLYGPGRGFDQGKSFQRPVYRFQGRVTADGSSGYPAVPGRYHLYISWGCPWAQRTAIVRKLKGLEDVISLSYVDDERDGRGWAFRERRGPDPVNGFEFLAQAYEATQPDYDGHVSVPALWDRETGKIVSNNFPDITLDLGGQFGRWARPSPDLYPQSLRPEIDALNERVYTNVNNGPYRIAGATSAADYENLRQAMVAMLEELDERLASRRFLVGGEITEADVRLWPTLARFDTGYNPLAGVTRRRLTEFGHLWGYARDLYQLPAFRDTTDFTAFGGLVRGPRPTFVADAPWRIRVEPRLADWAEPPGRGNLG